MCCFLPSTIKCKSVFLQKTGIDRKVKGMRMCTCTHICGYVGMWISLSYYFKLPSKFLYLWNWTFLSVSYVATTKLWCWHHNLYHVHNFYKLQLMVVLILHFEVIWYMFNSFWRAFSFFFLLFYFWKETKTGNKLHEVTSCLFQCKEAARATSDDTSSWKRGVRNWGLKILLFPLQLLITLPYLISYQDWTQTPWRKKKWGWV